MIDIDNTPILVGAGQSVERDAGSTSHLGMAAKAAATAISDCGGKNIAQSIDTICVIRLFSDSWHTWQSELGRSNNPPQSIAAAVGAEPEHRIYSQAGGNEPQSRLIEFFADIAAGKRDLVLLAGAEALRNQRSAAKQNLHLNWNEVFAQGLDDRGMGNIYPNPQEIANGLNMPMYFYALIEQARLRRLGVDQTAYRLESANMMATFSNIASRNPYAQWPGALSASQILEAEPLTHLYTKRMIAQDSVNQGAALLITSVSKARELGIPQDRWIFMHGAAQGADVDVSLRPDPSTSAVAARVLDKALDMAECSVADIGLFDVYSCFPCAVTAITDHLQLPTVVQVITTVCMGWLKPSGSCEITLGNAPSSTPMAEHSPSTPPVSSLAVQVPWTGQVSTRGSVQKPWSGVT